MFGSPCFDPLRQKYGEAAWAELCKKVKPINGDITFDGLGISNEDRALLTREVQLIVHLAATVDFNTKLNLAIQMNTLGALRVLALAKACTKL